VRQKGFGVTDLCQERPRYAQTPAPVSPAAAVDAITSHPTPSHPITLVQLRNSKRIAVYFPCTSAFPTSGRQVGWKAPWLVFEARSMTALMRRWHLGYSTTTGVSAVALFPLCLSTPFSPSPSSACLFFLVYFPFPSFHFAGIFTPLEPIFRG
jgi:hypothetical protein